MKINLNGNIFFQTRISNTDKYEESFDNFREKNMIHGESESWLVKNGFGIVGNWIDCSNFTKKIEIINHFSPVFGINGKVAISKMVFDLGHFEVAVSALCESLLIELDYENFISLANEDEDEDEDKVEWEDHLRHLRSLQESFQYEMISRISPDREYTYENKTYYIGGPGENQEEEEILDPNYESLIINTRKKIRANYFSSW